MLVPETALPARYQTPWKGDFVSEALQYVSPGALVLDVGGGARATLDPVARPEGCRYIGLDPDRNGLGVGQYDERIHGSIEDSHPELVGTVDLIISMNTLEHIPNMCTAVTRLHELLKPDGVLLAQFAGRWAFFAVASRLMPHQVRTRLLASLIDGNEEDHFPTVYDQCTDRHLDQLLSSWSKHEITPYYRAAGYFAFSRPLQRAYLAYEDHVAMHTSILATHYRVRAVK